MERKYDQRRGPGTLYTPEELDRKLTSLLGEERINSDDSIVELDPTSISEVLIDLFSNTLVDYKLYVSETKGRYLSKKINGISSEIINGMLNGKRKLNYRHFKILQAIFPNLKDKLVEKYRENLNKRQK